MKDAAEPAQVAASHHQAVKYRPDIDGLRAFAVLSVVAFHAFPLYLKSGFVGVDIFFVISGYLITEIIFSDLKGQRFSFLVFYGRRIRRIFPALFIVLLVCLLAGWGALLPDEFTRLGTHVAAGAGFIANLALWHESGYFDAAANLKPLQHLWSLGVEEQFYIGWPPLLLWLRHRRVFGPALFTIALLSLGLNIWYVEVARDSVSAFYSPFARFFELMIGAALTYVNHDAHSLVRRMQPFSLPISLAGGVLLVYSVVFIPGGNAFPSYWALLPTLGAALLIFAGPKTWLNRFILSNPIAVWFGLISYPLYLWHWPLLSYARIIAVDEPNRIVKIALVLISIALAWATYRLVEVPFRTRGNYNFKAIVLFGLMTIVAVAGVAVVWQKGFPSRIAINPATAQALLLPYPHDQHNPTCDRTFPELSRAWACMLSKPSVPDAVIVGDSHANQYYKSLAAALPRQSIMNLSESACLPFSSNAHHDDGGRCAAITDLAWKFIIDEPRIKTVYLTGYFSFLSSHALFGDSNSYRQALPPSADDVSSFEKGAEVVIARLLAAHKKVVLIEDIPDMTFGPRECLKVYGWPIEAIRFRGGARRWGRCYMDREGYAKRIAPLNKLMRLIEGKFPALEVFDPRPLLCSDKLCFAMRGGVPLYWNSDHLTRDGADLVVRKMLDSMVSTTGFRAH